MVESFWFFVIENILEDKKIKSAQTKQSTMNIKIKNNTEKR